jgi:hypothetical protein
MCLQLKAEFAADSELHEPVSSTWTSKGNIEALLDSYRDFAPVWKGLLACVALGHGLLVRRADTTHTLVQGKTLGCGSCVICLPSRRGSKGVRF